MTLDQLYTFAEVCHCKSIKKAAANLYISYQAVSRSIHKLEEELNTVLFTRSPEGVSMTPAGKTLLAHVEKITYEMSLLKHDMNDFNTNASTTEHIKISMAPALMANSADKLAEHLSQAFPNLFFQFSSLIYGQEPHHDDADISIRLYCDTPALPGRISVLPPYAVKQLSYFPLYYWISGSSPLVEYNYLDFSLLKNTPCVLFKQRFDITQYYSLYYGFSKTLLEHKPLIAELESNLIEFIERHRFFTIDIRSPIDDSLFFEDLFAGHNIVLKQSHYGFYLTLIYDKQRLKYVSDVIASFFTNATEFYI